MRLAPPDYSGFNKVMAAEEKVASKATVRARGRLAAMTLLKRFWRPEGQGFRETLSRERAQKTQEAQGGARLRHEIRLHHREGV
jgi:hypothetical protein